MTPFAWLVAQREDVAAGTTLILTDAEALLKFDVAAEVAVMITLPTLLAVTFPVDETVAMVVSEDLKDRVPLAPAVETVAVLPTATCEADVLAVRDCVALLILKVFEMDPV